MTDGSPRPLALAVTALWRGLMSQPVTVAAADTATATEWTDREIAHRIEDELFQDPGVSANDIHITDVQVSVANRHVVLSGMVDSSAAKQAAERAPDTRLAC